MEVLSAIEWLKENGYTYEKVDNDVFETHHLYKRTKSSDCQCNDKPPSIIFEIMEHTQGNSMAVRIRAESTSGMWVDVGYYAMEVARVKDLSEIEYTLVKMWECAN